MMKFIIIHVLLGSLGQYSMGVPLYYSPTDLDGNIIPFVVGGVDATNEVAKYTAAIVVGEHIKTLVCGGSIVTRTCIVTAAHCIDPFVSWTGDISPTYHGIVGKTEWNNGIVVGFKEAHIHPQYNSTIIKYDVGVLYMTKEVVLSDAVGLIALNFDWVDSGVEGYVAGWGLLQVGGSYPTKLQLLRTYTIPLDVCEFEVAMQGALRGGAPPVHGDVEICTLHSLGIGTCNGDSGSALVSAESHQQIGIVSWGFPCALGAPDMFTRVAGVKDFLISVLIV